MPDSNRPLSQSEIDALLSAIGSTESEEPAEADRAPYEEILQENKEKVNEPSGMDDVAPHAYAAISESRFIDLKDPQLRRILHLPVTLAVSMGGQELTIKSLLKWGIGSQIVLDQRWQQPILVKINGASAGDAQVVLVGNNFGVKISRWGRPDQQE